jgi:hypothetical protein
LALNSNNSPPINRLFPLKNKGLIHIMEHPHKIDYYQFPQIIKPVYKPDDKWSAPIDEPENTEKEWWDDGEADE